MAKNLLVINIDIRETRVALIEGGIIAELHLERHSARGTLGNVVLGKVSRVLPGMQAAFIDIGQERAAFLHVEDLIRPDDFEAYLAGQRGGHRHEAVPTAVEAALIEQGDAGPGAGVALAPSGSAAEPSSEEEAAWAEELEAAADNDDDVADDAAEEAEPDDGAAELEAAGADEDLADADPSEETDDATSDDEAANAADEDAEATALEARAEAGVDVDLAELAQPDAGGELHASDLEAREAAPAEQSDAELVAASQDELDEAGEADASSADTAGAPAGDEADEAGQRAKRSRRRGGRGRRKSVSTADRKLPDPPPPAPAAVARAEGRGSRGGGGDRGRTRGREGRGGAQAKSAQRESRRDPLRVSKSTPIREVVREGQEVVVQVSKEPIGTKGARVTSHISLPGRYVVYLPTVEHLGISKRIGSDKERARLREAIEAMKPPSGGLIVRTLAEGLTKKSLKSDVGYLVRLWGEIVKKREGARSPEVLYAELDLVLKTARDLFTDDIEKIVIDSREEFMRLQRFVEMFMPERVGDVELYEGEEPIFDAYGIEDEIGRALSRKVPLPSGGHLIIDQAEALTAIDVNTGRFVGKGSKDLEDTILQTNLEAVEEIAYQLRFRNIGGLIILDLIDMERASNREKVRRKLEQLLSKDKAKTTLNRISDLGLIEMTRKRTRESLGRTMNEPCFYCDGTGNLQSKQTVAYEILRQIKRERRNLRGYTVLINAHPAVVDLLKNEERGAVVEAERRYTRRIELVPRKEYHLEQFDLVGK
jgi:ribonuclease G